MTTDTALPPVNPWDVVPSEPVESTGWANFENFENTLSIENSSISENKKPCDEPKQKTSETTEDSKGTSSIEGVEDGDEKSKVSADGEAIETTDLPAAETNIDNSRNDEDKTITADSNANPSNLPADR